MPAQSIILSMRMTLKPVALIRSAAIWTATDCSPAARAQADLALADRTREVMPGADARPGGGLQARRARLMVAAVARSVRSTLQTKEGDPAHAEISLALYVAAIMGPSLNLIRQD